MIGNAHTAYQGLVAELGLTLVPELRRRARASSPTPCTTGSHVGDAPPWFSREDHASHAQVERPSSPRCARPSTPTTRGPTRTPSPSTGSRCSGWLRACGATPTVVRALEAGQLGLSRRLVRAHLAARRSCASARVTATQGSLRLRRVGEPAGRRGLGHRGAADGRGARRPASGSALPVRPVKVAPRRLRGRALDSGEIVHGRRRGQRPAGRPAARHRRRGRLRRAARLAAPAAARAGGEVRAPPTTGPFWRDRGRTASPSPRACSARHLAAERRHPLLPGAAGAARGATSPPAAAPSTQEAARRARRLVRRPTRSRRSPPSSGCGAPTRGPRATSPSGAPATCIAVGPLHGTHEPPFYVCGSDQWVAGYMEGAVRTGRGAAAEVLARG